MEIIPAIDIINGQCVRLSQGNYNHKIIYSTEPLKVAINFENAGIKYLHLVDLDGAKSGQLVHLNILKLITSNTSLKVDYSGGIRSMDDIEKVLDAGAHWITLGSIAVTSVTFVEQAITQFSPQKFMIGADSKDEIIYIKGWTEKTDISLITMIERYYKIGIKRFFCTDIKHDGVLKGPNITLYQKILSIFPAIDLIASGGVSSIEDIQKLKDIGCKGVIIGKALYENKIKLDDLVKLQ